MLPEVKKKQKKKVGLFPRVLCHRVGFIGHLVLLRAESAGASATPGPAIPAGRMLSRMLLSLINNLHVVEKLAESRPIRRAAQITAYAITKAQIAGRGASERVLRSQTLREVRKEAGRVPADLGEINTKLRRVKDTFVNEVKEGWKDGSRQIKK